jgi:hypothetical protein
MLKKHLRLLLLVVILGLFSACSTIERGNSAYYLVDPRFSELYQRLQGDSVLGPPISNKRYVAGTNLEKQYFEGVVMVFDPDHSPRYYLEPVGLDAGFSDLPNSAPENPGVRFLNGYIVPADFSQFYDRMGGERWVGKPLTRARLNPEKNAIEQYFENMGFFRYADEDPGVVHLMPYGLWKCAGECSIYPGLGNAGISSTVKEEVPSPFGEAISRFGTQFTGNTVTAAYRADDDTVEQVFQNVVLYQDSTSALGVALRPISVLLDQPRDPYQAREADSQEYYREVQEGEGYYIPSYFMAFLDRYFGFVVSGEPISRLHEIRDGVYQQCFENYCLLYDALADPSQQVRLLPQGQKYKEAFQKNVGQASAQPQVEHDIQLDIWEQLPQITSQENQQIGACIHESGSALINMQAEVSLLVPGQETIKYQFQPTDSGGCSFLSLEPVSAANGTTVDYQVCFRGTGDQVYCQKDSFLIWGNPESEPPEPLADEFSTESTDQGNVLVDTWELYSQVSSTERQEIGVCAHQQGQPLPGLSTQVILEKPDGDLQSYQGTMTDNGGCAFLTLDPVQANNGQTVAYQVCLSNQYGENFCTKDSFLIWGNP